jgi:predicted nucleic acid-binding protein
MSEIVLDANVIVGLLDEGDSLSERATELFGRLEADGHRLVFLDFLVAEALSALCRRSFQRKHNPIALAPILKWIRERRERGFVHFIPLVEDDFAAALEVVESSGGELNFNDARLVVMQQSGEIGEVASFDADFESIDGFRLIS